MSASSYFVHPKAICETESVGAGTRIWAFTHVLGGAQIGKDCNLGEHVFVENGVSVGDGCRVKNGVALWEGVTLEEGVFVGPYAVFTNDLRPRAFLKDWKCLKTRVCRGATVGAGAVVVCGTTIGRYAMVGAGAVVTKDVPEHGLVLGNPARLVGKVCFCGQRLENDFCNFCDLQLSENSEEKTLASQPES